MLHFLSLLIVASLFAGTTFAQEQEDPELVPCMGKGRGRNSTALRSKFNEADILPRGRIGARSPIYEVYTYAHVITTTAKKDAYTMTMVQNQIEVMNKAYSGSFVFTLKDVDFTVHDIWATTNTDDIEQEYKTTLHKGNYADLNLYFLSDLGAAESTTLLGFCYMPENVPDSLEMLLNGCSCLASTMPGGGSERFGMGMTTVHEVGHWFGLYHTFEDNTCSGPGDFVSDTPMQSMQTTGCPAFQDSCPGSPGVDGIHNYMDYSDDDCLSEFTPGQIARMTHAFGTMRWGK